MDRYARVYIEPGGIKKRESNETNVPFFLYGNKNFVYTYWIVKRAVSPNASGTKLMRGIMSASGFQSNERLSGMF